MGQGHSDEYECGEDQTEDVADCEINSSEQPEQRGVSEKKDQPSQRSKMPPITQRTLREQQQQQLQMRKLSSVSHRNIQLLSMKPRGEKDSFADDLRTRRRSSLINLILGAPSSGPRFSHDLCSLNSRISDFGIEFFPETYNINTSVSSLRLESIEDAPALGPAAKERRGQQVVAESNQKRRRSSLGSLVAQLVSTSSNPSGVNYPSKVATQHDQDKDLAPSGPLKSHPGRKPSIASTLASIDLTSSFEKHDLSRGLTNFRPPLCKTKQTIFESSSQESLKDVSKLNKSAIKGRRVNQTGRVLRRSGSELSLYSNASIGSAGGTGYQRSGSRASSSSKLDPSGSNCDNSPRETKLIIMLQVCLPFMLAGFGNMGAGLVLNKVAQWRAFHQIPSFFILLPPLIGMKGNIEMTLASRLSTLANLNLLDTGHQRRRAYTSNLVLILSQAIGLSLFATIVSILCQISIGSAEHESYKDVAKLIEVSVLVVLAAALVTSVILVIISSIIMSFAIGLANLIQVNPDNLSTLMAALYGDVSCVLTYGLVADWMFTLHERDNLTAPLIITISILSIWPFLLYMAYSFKETRTLALPSLPPMLASILISMGSGATLSMFVDRFKLIALYQPVVNGFGANLIAVQASRVSTWLWCSALRKIKEAKVNAVDVKKIHSSLASFTSPPELSLSVVGGKQQQPQQQQQQQQLAAPPRPSLMKLVKKFVRTILWSFVNSSPNSIAARLLLIMLAPAHTIYFFTIWVLSPTNYIVITWQFYSIYIALCLTQVFILLTICEPLMTLLMKRNLDPDIFGISILMALADLAGTLCLAGAFCLLASLGDVNAS